MVSQTIRAHRLSRKAYLLGGQELQEKFLEIVLCAYFTEGKNIGDFNVLGDLAEEVGVMTKDKVCGLVHSKCRGLHRHKCFQRIPQAIEFLTSNECQEEVESMAAEARKKGVTGVPFTIINGRWAVSGGQTAEVYGQVHCRSRFGSPCTDRFAPDFPQAGWQRSPSRHPQRSQLLR